MEENHQDYQRGVLLGDSGYPCRPFLMTPYLNPVTDAEIRFNTAHTGTRNLIERVFGMWNRKFHVLPSEIRVKTAKCSKGIVVCATLYNLALLWKEPDVVDVVVDEQSAADTYNGQIDGRGVRAHIASAYFS
ncbi:putative nuclease HARBI1 [Dreissena polymorpha]|uniref:putative nuclease HARBI1 n=1 Tax=Dreissena polymorpha TaxID=45954 RepID=UPI002264CA38|nr:putative nuclease HARBI1 [Dreissena polymorpha]